MLNFNSVMIGTSQPKVLIDFYRKIFPNKPDIEDKDWAGWKIGDCFFNIGLHSEVSGQSSEPARIIVNFETDQIKEEFERIKNTGAKVVKELYEMEGMEGMWIATFSDPDENYFQLMTPWKGEI